MKYLVTLVFVLLLAACDSKIGATHPSSIEGTYTSLDGKDSYVFASGGQVQTVTFGKPKQATYTLEDNSIKFQFAGGLPQTFVLNADGSLTTHGVKLTKK